MQAQRQGKVAGSKDAGARSAVTGGAQMIENFIASLLDQFHSFRVPK